MESVVVHSTRVICAPFEDQTELSKSYRKYSHSSTVYVPQTGITDLVLHTKSNTKQISVCHFGMEIRTDTCWASLRHSQWKNFLTYNWSLWKGCSSR